MRAFALAAVLSAFLITVMPLRAEEGDAARKANDGFANEVVTCAAYQLIRMEFLRTGGRNNYILMAELMADKMLHRAEQLLGAEKSQVEIRAAGLRLLEETGNDIGKIYVLNERYGTTCHDVYADPDARLAYWVETIRTGAVPVSFRTPVEGGRSGRRADSP